MGNSNYNCFCESHIISNGQDKDKEETAITTTKTATAAPPEKGEGIGKDDVIDINGIDSYITKRIPKLVLYCM